MLKMSNNAPLKSDYVVIAVGIEPDVEIAEASGLEVCNQLLSSWTQFYTIYLSDASLL